MKRFIQDWREWGFRNAWVLLTDPEPVPTYGHENMHYRSGYQAGIEVENRRILQLLYRACDCDKSHLNAVIHSCQNRIAIALIKGEN